MTTVVQAATTDTAAANLDDIVFWLIVGLAFLWVIAMAAEVTLQKLKPVLVFIVVAALVGYIVIKAFSGI